MKLPLGPERGPLFHAEVRWLMRLRWLAADATVLMALVPWDRIGWQVPRLRLAALGVAIGLANAAYWLVDRRVRDLSRRLPALQTFASVQIGVDLLALFALVHWTGGLHSPFFGFLIFPTIFSGLLQTRARAYAAGAVTLAFLAASLLLATRRAWGQDWGQDWGAIERTDALIALAWATTLVVTMYLTDRITRGLYRRELARIRQARRARLLAARVQSQQQLLVQQEKIAALGQLAAGIAHEITNPLSNMDSVLQLMQRRPEQPRPEAVNNLREQIQRINRTIRQITTFANPGRGSFEITPVNDAVRSSLELLAFDRRLKAATLDLALDDHAGEARLNTHALQQVLANLYRNALDAIAGNAPARPAGRLRVATRREGHAVVIDVTDNGPGIAPEHLGRIFDPFFTTKPPGQGTGLGLSISAGLIREHGGTITASSEPGGGTTFSIRLPGQPHTPHVASPAVAPRDPAVGAHA